MSLDTVKVKGVITWVGANDAVPAEPHPEAGGKDFL